MPKAKDNADLAVEAIDAAYKQGVDRLFSVAMGVALTDQPDNAGATSRFKVGLAILNETRQRLIDAVRAA